MNKLGLAIISAAVLTTASGASSEILSEGDRVAGGSIGLSLASWNNAATFGANYEQGFIDDVFPDFNLGLGALLQYANYSWFNDNFSITTLAAQANLHYDLGIENFQPYGGLLLGFSVVSGDWGNNNSSLGLGAQVGGRYYFRDDLAATVRLNTSAAGFGGYSVLSAGVDYKF